MERREHLISLLRKLLVWSPPAIFGMVLAVYGAVTICIGFVYSYLSRLYLFPVLDASLSNRAEVIGFEGINGVLLVVSTAGGALALLVWSVVTYSIVRAFIARRFLSRNSSLIHSGPSAT